MIKKLKQVLQPNPSVPYIKAGKEKEFAGIHKVLKTKSPAYTSNGQNDDEVYNASKIKVAPRPRGSKSPESSPKDSYGEGRISYKVSPDNSEDEYGGHDEETKIDEKSTHGATHQLRIARKTLLMPDAMANVMGGMNKKEAAEIIRRSRQRLKRNEPTVMTHEETINELSTKLLKRYTKKAEPEAEGYGTPVQGYGHKSFKRMKGVSAAHEIMRDRKHPVRAKVHDVRHMSDGEIYDHTQTHDGIKDGDVLHMSKGRAGIMMKAWPTMHHGSSDALHSLKDGSSWDTSFRGRYKKSHEVAGNIKEDLDENHIHMTVTHESNTKPLFKAKAGSDAEVRTKLESLKANSKGYNYRVGVQNTKTGETWSGKPHHKFPGFGEEVSEAMSPEHTKQVSQIMKRTGLSKKGALSKLGVGNKGELYAKEPLTIKEPKRKNLRKEDLFIEQIPSIPPDQPIGLKPLAKASSIEGLARRGVKLRVAQKKHELLKKRII